MTCITLPVHEHVAGAGSTPGAAVLQGQLREPRTLLEATEFGNGLLLQLPHPLPTDAEAVPNVLETLRLVCVQTIAPPHNQGLTWRESAETCVHATADLRCRHERLGRRGLRILQDILERRPVVRARLLQRDQ